MSYSVISKAPSKSEAVSLIHARLDEVLASQPVHAADIEQAKSAIASFVDALREPVDGEVIKISASGSVSYNWQNEKEIAAINFSMNAIITKPDPV